MKHLAANLVGFLAAALAVLFIFGAVYCMVLLDTISPGLRRHVSFADVVNISIRVASIALLIAVLSIMFTGLIARFRDIAVRKWLRSWEKEIRAVWQVIMTIFFLGIISYVLYNGFWRPFYTVYENRPAPLGMLKLIIVFGMMISLIAWYIIPKTARERACELIPLLVWPPVMLAIVSLAAATEAAGVKECKEPFTAIYDGGVNHKPDDSQVCPIMSLERGLLVYDKAERATVFIPWAQLTRLISPKSPSAVDQTDEGVRPPPAPAPSTPSAAPGNGPPAGEAPPR